MPDPFESLGLGWGAAPGDIRAAFRRLVVRAHPDHGGSPETLAALTEAREAALRISEKEPCPHCAGAGHIELTGGFRRMPVRCRSCDGSGKKWP
jgi:DnaJ-class molecular chaperone